MKGPVPWRVRHRGDFDEIDPFNGNRVRGFIRRSNRRKGNLEITHVNGKACEQYVRGTPSFATLSPQTTPPAEFDQVLVFEKLDGANILLFRYQDAEGTPFVSYKTRLAPFLRPQAFGDFAALWRSVLDRYACEILTLTSSPHHFGFELFGRSLPMPTRYGTDLDARLLYAVDAATGEIIEPEANPEWRFPTPARWGEYPAGTPVELMHRETVAHAERQLDEGHPTEGAVLHVVRGGRATLYKCKPPAVVESQARYVELFAVGRAGAKAGADAQTVTDDVRAHVVDHWPPQVRAREQRVIEVVCNHVRKEVVKQASLRTQYGVQHDTQQRTQRGTQQSPPVESTRPDHLPRPTDPTTVLWSTVWGSHLWGMNHAASDRDRSVVYQLDDRTLALAAFDPNLLQPHRRGFHRKLPEGDEHWYELGRAVQLLLDGSLTMLLGVISPLVDEQVEGAHTELRSLLEGQPSRAFHRSLLRDVSDSEKAMGRAPDDDFYRKHLRIACRNLRFAITLLTEGRYEFAPSAAVDPQELALLKDELAKAHRSSPLPEQFDPGPFHDYVVRQRRRQSRLDEAREETER